MIKLILLIFISSPVWVLFTLLRTTLILIGWIVIPIAAAIKSYIRFYDHFKASKKENPWVYHFKSKYMWLWDNDEDGIANDMYWKAPNLLLQIVYWSCLRNPVNNLRFVPYLSVKINPNKVYFIGNLDNIFKYDNKIPQWFFAWQGIYSNFYWQFMLKGKLRRLWIGWKIYPTDVLGLSESDYRYDGAGFALQFKEVK